MPDAPEFWTKLVRAVFVAVQRSPPAGTSQSIDLDRSNRMSMSRGIVSPATVRPAHPPSVPPVPFPASTKIGGKAMSPALEPVDMKGVPPLLAEEPPVAPAPAPPLPSDAPAPTAAALPVLGPLHALNAPQAASAPTRRNGLHLDICPYLTELARKDGGATHETPLDTIRARGRADHINPRRATHLSVAALLHRACGASPVAKIAAGAVIFATRRTAGRSRTPAGLRATPLAARAEASSRGAAACRRGP